GFLLLVPIAIVYALIIARRDRAEVKTSMPSPSGAIFVSLFSGLLAFALGNNLLFGGWPGFMRHVDFILGPGSQPWRMFPNTLAGQVELLFFSTTLLSESLGLASLVLCAAGVLIALYERRWLALSILLFPVSYYLLFIAPVGYAY